MKKKKIISLLVIILIILPLISFVYLDIRVKKSQLKYWLTDNSRNYTNYDSIKCRLFSLEYAFVDTYKNNHIEIYFHKINMKDLFFPNGINWENNYTGGTDIKNTTFPELVKMVKEDCSQFQDDYDNPKVDEGGIDWGYREAEPPKSQEEIDSDKKWEIMQIKGFLNGFTEKVNSMIKDRYGDWTNMTDDELLELAKKVRADDEIQRYIYPLDDEYVYITDEDYIPVMDYIKYRFSTFYGDQPEEFIKFYGDPTTMTDAQLLKIAKDYIENDGFDKSLNEYFIYM